MAKLHKPLDPIEQIARSLNLLVKLKLEEVKRDRNQREMIHLLAGLEIGGGDIADLLNISRKTVDPELSKLRAGQKNSGNSSKPAGKRKA
jgi:hypothetical protein